MNRDPNNFDITKDPIFILLTGRYCLTADIDGTGTDGESCWIDDIDEIEDWMLEFTYHDDDEGGPPTNLNIGKEFYVEAMKHDHCKAGIDVKWCEIKWEPERVFLTRQEGEDWAKRREYRWDCWKVYCVCAEGELAKVLNDLPEAGVGT